LFGFDSDNTGRVDLFELAPREEFVHCCIIEDIPYGEKVRDVVLTAAYAVLGRWNEAYTIYGTNREQ
jgi:iron complex transport system ATP-binding protein